MPDKFFIAGESGHVRLTCSKDDCGGSCAACCLYICEVCGLYEGGLTTHCPGKPSFAEHALKIYDGKEDYVNGEWITK